MATLTIYDSRCKEPVAEAETADELWRMMLMLRSRGCPVCGWEIELLTLDVEAMSGEPRRESADQIHLSGLPEGDLQRERHRCRVLPMLRLAGDAPPVRAPAPLREQDPEPGRSERPVRLVPVPDQGVE